MERVEGNFEGSLDEDIEFKNKVINRLAFDLQGVSFSEFNDESTVEEIIAKAEDEVKRRDGYVPSDSD